MRLSLGIILSAVLSAPLWAQNSIALPELRACAENEPALGTLIAFPTLLPDNLLVELAEDDLLYVNIDDAQNQAVADAAMRSMGVNMANVRYIDAPTEDFYTRDYGSPQVFFPGGHAYVDPWFDSYAYQAGDGGKVTFSSLMPDNDASPEGIADYLGVPYINFPARLVGGNIDFDGLGKAFCTRVLVDENRAKGFKPKRFRKLMDWFYGVRHLMVMPNFELYGIQHVDCVLKVLDAETLVVTQVPVTHPTYAMHEAVFRKAKQMKTAFGRPYVIHRIQTPVFNSWIPQSTANYANTLILNGKILVPLFNLPQADAAALDVYREAMPGYEVIGFPYNRWFSFDSLHCRTHQVFDPEMLLIKHPRIRNAAANASIPVQALMRNYGGSQLDPAQTVVKWRIAGSANWQTAAFQQGNKRGAVLAQLPGQSAGTEIEYYLEAATIDGKFERKPPLATTHGAYSFMVQ